MLVLFLTSLILGCDKNEDPEIIRSFSWTIGSEYTVDTVIVLPESNGESFLFLDEYSVCPTHKASVTLFLDDEILFSREISDTLGKTRFNYDPENLPSLRTKLIQGDSMVQCIWLGQAKFKIEYQE